MGDLYLKVDKSMEGFLNIVLYSQDDLYFDVAFSTGLTAINFSTFFDCIYK